MSGCYGLAICLGKVPTTDFDVDWKGCDHENQACRFRRCSRCRFGLRHRSRGLGVRPSGFRLRRFHRCRWHSDRHRCGYHGHHRDHPHASSRHALRASLVLCSGRPRGLTLGPFFFFLDLLRCNTFGRIFYEPVRQTWEGALRDSILLYINHRNDSIARASREAAESIILRHDILYSPLLSWVAASLLIAYGLHCFARSLEARK